MSVSRQARANQRQTPRPDQVAARLAHLEHCEEQGIRPGVWDWKRGVIVIDAPPGSQAEAVVRRISSQGGRRGGLIPTAPVVRARYDDTPRPTTRRLVNEPAGPPLQPGRVCANCGTPFAGALRKVNSNGQWVHAKGCPAK